MGASPPDCSMNLYFLLFYKDFTGLKTQKICVGSLVSLSVLQTGKGYASGESARLSCPTCCNLWQRGEDKTVEDRSDAGDCVLMQPRLLPSWRKPWPRLRLEESLSTSQVFCQRKELCCNIQTSAWVIDFAKVMA